MTDSERLAMSALIRSLEAVQWAIPHRPSRLCPSCRYQQIRGHRCSCPIRLALRNAGRVMGTEDARGSLDDDDLIVEQAMQTVVTLASDKDSSLRALRDAVRVAVDAAVAYGQRGGDAHAG